MAGKTGDALNRNFVRISNGRLSFAGKFSTKKGYYIFFIAVFNDNTYPCDIFNFIRIEFGKATGNCNPGFGILPDSPAHYIEGIGVGMMGYGAGINNAKVRRGAVVYFSISGRQKLLPDELAVVLIRFASQSKDFNRFHIT